MYHQTVDLDLDLDSDKTEEEINKCVDELMAEWKQSTRSTQSIRTTQSDHISGSLLESKRRLFRQKVISSLNEDKLLRRSGGDNCRKGDACNKFSMYEIVGEIRDDMKGIKNEMKGIRDDMEKLKFDLTKMVNHIDFVEGTYETLRSPLDYVTTKINRLRGLENTETLPELPKIKE